MLLILRELRYLLTPRERRNGVILFCAMFVGAILEMGAVGAIPGFVALLTNSSRVRGTAVGRAVLALLPARPEMMLLTAAVALVLIFLVKNCYVAVVTYLEARFALNRQVSISRKLFQAYLYSPYTFHLQRNTAELLRNTNRDAQNVVGEFLLPALTLTMECLTSGAILLLLFVAEPLISLVASLVLGGATLVFVRVIRSRLVRYALEMQRHGGKMIQVMNEGLGSVKITKVLGREEHFVQRYTTHAEGFAAAARFRQVTTELPRLFLEVCAMLGLLVVAALLLVQHRPVATIVPALSLLAVAVVRMIPSFNRITASLTTMRYGRPALSVVYNDLRSLANTIPATGAATLTDSAPFATSIRLEGVDYEYPGAPRPSLRGITLEIPKGSTVGFVGPTGAGKTTLVDVVLGLLPPTSGRVLVDGRDINQHAAWWRRHVGYVPQEVYLTDDTIRRNIAFGIVDSDIDDIAVRRAIDAAQLTELVAGLPDGVNAVVGERGIRLSGGQRQRIGIARALYHDPEVLILDEATSSLDNETERYVMQSVEHLRGARTILMIAHRMSTVRACDKLFVLRDGCITGCGSWDSLRSESSEFRQMLGAGA